MKKLLLPHGFKKAGALMLPFGTALWIFTQKGWTTSWFPIIQTIEGFKNGMLILALCLFLFGWYGLTFSRERIEDEFVRDLRLKAFHAGALLQILFFFGIVLLSLSMGWVPGNDTEFLILFMIAVLLYWLTYIVYFNGSLLLLNLKSNDQ